MARTCPLVAVPGELKARPLTLYGIEGHLRRCNDAVFQPALPSSARPSALANQRTLVYFGGDIQNLSHLMDQSDDSVIDYQKWCLEETAMRLSHDFPSCHVVVIKPSRVMFDHISCFDNFVESNFVGIPKHYYHYVALMHLEKLLKTISVTVRQADPDILFKMLLRTLEEEKFQEKYKIENGTSWQYVHISAEKKRMLIEWQKKLRLHKYPLTLVAFSKGCVVLNQFLYEFHYARGLEPNHQDSRFIERIRDMYWLDSGNIGRHNIYLTSVGLLRTLANLDLIVHVHVSMYMVEDENRPWIGEQYNEFINRLVALNGNVLYFRHISSTEDLKSHFKVLLMFMYAERRHKRSFNSPKVRKQRKLPLVLDERELVAPVARMRARRRKQPGQSETVVIRLVNPHSHPYLALEMAGQRPGFTHEATQARLSCPLYRNLVSIVPTRYYSRPSSQAMPATSAEQPDQTQLTPVQTTASAQMPSTSAEVSMSAQMPSTSAEVSMPAQMPSTSAEVSMPAQMPSIPMQTTSAQMPLTPAEVSMSAQMPSTSAEVSMPAQMPSIPMQTTAAQMPSIPMQTTSAQMPSIPIQTTSAQMPSIPMQTTSDQMPSTSAEPSPSTVVWSSDLLPQRHVNCTPLLLNELCYSLSEEEAIRYKDRAYTGMIAPVVAIPNERNPLRLHVYTPQKDTYVPAVYNHHFVVDRTNEKTEGEDLPAFFANEEPPEVSSPDSDISDSASEVSNPDSDISDSASDVSNPDSDIFDSASHVSNPDSDISGSTDDASDLSSSSVTSSPVNSRRGSRSGVGHTLSTSSLTDVDIFSSRVTSASGLGSHSTRVTQLQPITVEDRPVLSQRSTRRSAPIAQPNTVEDRPVLSQRSTRRSAPIAQPNVAQNQVVSFSHDSVAPRAGPSGSRVRTRDDDDEPSCRYNLRKRIKRSYDENILRIQYK